MEQMGFDQLLLTILMWEPKQKMAFSCILLLVGSFLLRRWMILATVIDVCAPAQTTVRKHVFCGGLFFPLMGGPGTQTHARGSTERMKKMRRRPQLSLVYNIPSSSPTWHEGRACTCCNCIYDKLTRLSPNFLFTSDCRRLVRGRSVNHPEAGHGDWSFMDVDFVSAMVRILIFMGCNSFLCCPSHKVVT